MQVVAKCLHFVMSYMNQNKKRKLTLESVQYGLEISFKLFNQSITKFVFIYHSLTAQGSDLLFFTHKCGYN